MNNLLIITLSDSSFKETVLKANLPVLVDFWAEWCGPCKLIAPILEELANEYDGKVKFCKLNVEKNTISPEKYRVRGIPTLILFKDGKVEGTKVGALSKAQLKDFLDDHLK